MSIKKILASIILAGTFTIGVAGCTNYNHREYWFEDKLEGEQVYFYEAGNGSVNVLKVTKPDGRIITYYDKEHDDLKLEAVTIQVEKEWDTYTKGPVLEEAQKQFDDYLKKIFDYKQQKGLKNLR